MEKPDIAQDMITKMYMHLNRLIWKLAWSTQDATRWQLDVEEIYAELICVLVYICNMYASKPENELIMIIKRSLYNKIADLKLACYKSHRNAEGSMISLSDSTDDEHGDWEEALGMEDSHFNTEDFMKNLSSDAYELADAVLHPESHDMITFHLSLAVARKQATSPQTGWQLTMTPTILQRGLGWDRLRLSRAWNEITQALKNC